MTLKVDTPLMIDFVDAAINKYNMEEFSSNKTTIRDCFRKVGQDPWYEDEDQLLAVKLEEYKECAQYKRDMEDDLLNSNSHAVVEADSVVLY